MEIDKLSDAELAEVFIEVTSKGDHPHVRECDCDDCMLVENLTGEIICRWLYEQGHKLGE